MQAAKPSALRGPKLQRHACACGGTCPRCRDEAHSGPKLAISAPGDAFEQEADRIADEVMRMPDPRLYASPALPRLQRKCAACGEEEKSKLQTKRQSSDAGSSVTTAPSIVHEVLRSPGQPLDNATRAFMEPRFGDDFSRVRVHLDSRATESARAVNALAYTVGRDVVFGAGQYAPQTTAGQRLLAHELTHVVQQRSGADSRLQRVEGPCEDIPQTLPHPFLIRGSVAPAVREAQRKLNAFHEQQIRAGKPGLADAPLVPDCIFGEHTFNAVLSFQELMFPSNPDFHTGNIGEHTWAELDKVAPEKKAPEKRKTCGVDGTFDKIPSGDLLATLSTTDQVTWTLSAPFTMTANFTAIAEPGEDPAKCNCRCGEYRQKVSGGWTVNGKFVSPPSCDGKEHDPLNLMDSWEDCVPTANGDLKYGYHDIPFQNSKFKNPDQATGCRYEGADEPSTSGSRGELLAIKLHFWGTLIDICNDNEELDSSEWNVFGSKIAGEE